MLPETLRRNGLQVLQDLPQRTSSHQYISYSPPNTDRLRFLTIQSTNPHPTRSAQRSGYSASDQLQRLYDRYPSARQDGHPGSHLKDTLALVNTVQDVRKSVLRSKEVDTSRTTEMGKAGTGGTSARSGEQDSGTTLSQGLDACGWEFLETCAMGELYPRPPSRYPLMPHRRASAKQALRRAREVCALPREWLALRSKELSVEEKSRRYIRWVCSGRLPRSDLTLRQASITLFGL